MGSLCGKKKDSVGMTRKVPLTASPGAVEVNPRRHTLPTGKAREKMASSGKSWRRSLPIPEESASPEKLDTIESKSDSQVDKTDMENTELEFIEIEPEQKS